MRRIATQRYAPHSHIDWDCVGALQGHGLCLADAQTLLSVLRLQRVVCGVPDVCAVQGVVYVLLSVAALFTRFWEGADGQAKCFAVTLLVLCPSVCLSQFMRKCLIAQSSASPQNSFHAGLLPPALHLPAAAATAATAQLMQPHVVSLG